MSGDLDIGAPRWNRGVKRQWGVTTSIGNLISQLELGKPEILPHVQYGPNLLLACDYGGQDKRATHEAFSFLLAELQFLRQWDELRQEVRTHILRDRRRMSFKGMNDRRKRDALVPFLRAANMISGLIFTVLVEKRFASKLRLSEIERDELPTTLRTWPVHTVQKLLWISHLGALVVAGLSAPGQNLFWISDQDDIAANVKLMTDATGIISGITSAYLPHDMGHMRFGTTASDSGNLLIEDTVAIPDLVAGALAEASNLDFFRHVSHVRVNLRNHVSRKTLAILGWLGEENHCALRRLSFVISEGDTAELVRARALEFHAD